MNIADIFWLFFIITAIQPILRQQFLEATRQRLIRKLEKSRNSRVITLIHRQETMSLLGFPIFRYIDVNDSEEVIRAIHLTDPDMPIDLIMHTPGGLVLASLQIARALHKHKGKVTVFVPFYAMSGGTLIALAADEIVMCRHSVLGPVDPQLGQYPAASLLKVREEKPIEKIDDQTLILADQAQKAMKQIEDAVVELLVDTHTEEEARNLARLLSSGKWTHDFAITYDYAKELKLPVSDKMPNEVLELLTLYPQPVKRVPTVEYLPERRERGSKA
ncbi:MAG: hypothetical protein D6780_00850 [Candidatus Dadabacteria bacterium]|nr:MAG: hypothetical protein D6780_00850 [Candidatus Dadabacteria bacterium]